jgi:DNA uptake protein ComE-like DNA-binding protein
MIKPLLVLITALALAASPALAETKQPAKETTKPAPAAPTKSTTPTAQKVNLNTATAQELDALPQIGPARAKAIIDARTKDKFKNWDDFVARKVVPSNAVTAIKDLVSF